MLFSTLRPLALLVGLLALPLAAARAQWTADSLQNTLVRDSAAHEETTPLVTTGPAGSTYISWFETVPGTNYQLRMQRLDSTGRPMWNPRGLIVSAFPQNTALFRYDLKSDRNGDALVAFQDERTGTLLPVICKVAADGTLPWGSGIVLRDSLATGGLAPTIGVTNANNVVVAWNADGGQAGWVAAQKFSANGTPLWSRTYRVRDAAGTIGYGRPTWLAAGADDALFFYIRQTGRFPFTSHMFVQQLTPAGQAAWTTQLTSTRSMPFFFFPAPISDGQDGAYLIYNTGNPANANLTTVFAQHLLAGGTADWGTDGVEVLTGTATQRYAASDGGATLNTAGELSVLVSVTDLNQNQSGLTLQRLDGRGTLLLGASGQTLVTPSADLHRAVGLRANANGDALAVYSSGGGLTQTISAIGLDRAGGTAWTVSPTRAVSFAASGKDDIGLALLRGDQLVAAWADNRLGSNGIYAQTISLRGRRGGVVTATPTLIAETSALMAWPNPGATARLQLPVLTESATLTLRDATGREVRRLSIAANTSENACDVPAAGLSSGLYLVTLQTGHQQWHARWVKE